MIRIELLYLADCPHIATARSLLISCMQELGCVADVEEREGAFPSPTILVNGCDVMSAGLSAEASCRLDTPTRERVLAALRGAGR